MYHSIEIRGSQFQVNKIQIMQNSSKRTADQLEGGEKTVHEANDDVVTDSEAVEFYSRIMLGTEKFKHKRYRPGKEQKMLDRISQYLLAMVYTENTPRLQALDTFVATQWEEMYDESEKRQAELDEALAGQYRGRDTSNEEYVGIDKAYLVLTRDRMHVLM